MADLDKQTDRLDWRRWAIELLRRGIWAGDTITVHGPHSPYDYMWGETEGETDEISGSGFCRTFSFRTASGIRGIYDVRGVTVRDDEGERYPVLPASELTVKARRWLLSAKAKDSARRLRESGARFERVVTDGAYRVPAAETFDRVQYETAERITGDS
jgi:hypothetical protein